MASAGYSLEKIVAGSLSTVAASGTLPFPSAGDWIEVVLSGSTITLLVNGVQVFTGTDAFNQTATKYGLQISTTVGRYGAFYVQGAAALAPAFFQAPRMIVSTSAPPTASAALAGIVWHTRSGAGVKDNVQVCAKDAGDAYAWRTIY